MFFSRMNIPQMTKNLLLINILVFVAILVNEPLMIRLFALFYPHSPYFHWWQVLTHMFMHGGWMHLIFNMYALYTFGSVLESYIGGRKFLIYYFACGFGAAALHVGVQLLQEQYLMFQIAQGSQAAMQSFASLKGIPTVGASGAIFGLLIGYAMLFPQARLTLIFPPVTLTAKTWIIIFAAIELLTGVSGMMDGIAHFAHLGGMLIGFVLIRYWRHKGTLFTYRY